MMLLALFAPWAAKAQETLTVYDQGGSTTSSYVPFWEFTTECEALTNFPITFGFETSEGFPENAYDPTSNPFGQCWRNEATVQTGVYPIRVWGTSTSFEHTGSQALILPYKGHLTTPAKS